MTKNSLILTSLLMAALSFTACNDDDEDDLPPAITGPGISITELNTGSMDGGDITIFQGQNLTFAMEAEEGANELELFDILLTGVNSSTAIPVSSEGNSFPLDLDGDNEELYRDTVVFIAGGTSVGVTNYLFSVTDENGAVSSVSFDVTVEENANLVTSDFTWNRTGSDPATGLDQFGLQWNENSTVNGTVSAIVKVDEATTFVELTESDWNSIVNSDALELAINGAVTNGASFGTDGYTRVSAEASDTYNDYLGVIYEGEPYILHIQNSDVTVITAGTSITITGEFKN